MSGLGYIELTEKDPETGYCFTRKPDCVWRWMNEIDNMYKVIDRVLQNNIGKKILINLPQE